MEPKKIILYDKDVFGLELLTKLFQEKYQLLKAKTPKEANAHLNYHKPHLFLYSQPFEDDDGMDLLQNLQINRPKIKRIILAVNKDSNENLQDLNPDLAHVWVQKPWNDKELQKMVDTLLTDLYFNDEFQKFNNTLSCLQEVIRTQNLKSLFQPIAQFQPLTVVGHELFTNGPKKLNLQKPENLIRMAHHAGLMLEFEEAARANAIKALGNGPYPKEIFLNNCPSLILNPEFEKLLLYDDLGIKPNNIVIEINECHYLDNLKEFLPRLKYYRSKGFKISVDDVGREHASLYLMTEIQPNYVKLDMSMVRGINNSSKKKNFVKNLVSYAKNSNMQIIAEGVETKSEFKALKKLGINLGQGYYFCKPQSTIKKLINVP